MNIPALAWLTWLPLIATPAVYLFGRLFHNKSQRVAQGVTLLALLGTWAAFVLAAQDFSRQGHLTFTLGMVALRLDGLSLVLAIMVLILATAVTLFSGAPLAEEVGAEKYYAMLLAMSGAMIGVGCAADLFNLWLWFEAMAITSYLLVAFYREQPASLEAGVKYLVQSATGSVLVLFGVALVLAETGVVNLAEIQTQATPSPLLLTAGALFVIGFGVKIALVPMHTWLPDAHAQAPSGISAMLSGVVIEAGLVALLRALASLSGIMSSWGILLMGFGALNMVVGNLLAFSQVQVKRLLAFSSISHIGYMLLGLGIAVYAKEGSGAQAGLFHLINHGFMKGLAFLTVGALLYLWHSGTNVHQPLTIADVSGIAWSHPGVALPLTLALLGLGGIPPLAGFMSKWQILAAGMETGQRVIIGLVAFAALNSLFSLAYYLPLINTLFRREASTSAQARRPLPVTIYIPLNLLAFAIMALGIWPDLIAWLTEPAGNAVLSLFLGS